MSQRPDKSEPSTSYIQIRLTPEERDRIKGLAHYRQQSVSDMLREFAETERDRLIKSGVPHQALRAPRPAGEEAPESRGPKTPRGRRRDE
jgi:hypothetical protein